MPEPRVRPFGLSDAMLLVVATTPGMLLIRTCLDLGLFTHLPDPKDRPGTYFMMDLSVATGCVLPGLTLAVLLVSARRPHPPWKEVVAGPGFVACAAAMLAVIGPVIYFAAQALVIWNHGEPNFVTPTANFFHRWVNGAGPLIVGAWFAMALAGRLRLGETWTDRLGCLIGLCWVVTEWSGELFFILISPLMVWWRS